MAGPKPLLRKLLPCALAFGVLLGWGCAERKKEPEIEAPKPLRIENEIETIVDARGEGLGLNDTVGIATTWERLEAFYQKRRHRPYWSNGRQLRQQAKDLLNTIHRVEEAGLDPLDYEWAHLDRLAAQSER